jgi:hypothetical protein
MKGPLLGTDPAIDHEEAMIGSIFRGCWRGRAWALTVEFDAKYFPAAPDHFARSSLLIALNKGQFEAVRNGERLAHNDFSSVVREIHDLALGRRRMLTRDPGSLLPDHPFCFALLLLRLHWASPRAQFG